MALPKFWLGWPQCIWPTNNWPVCSLILHCGQLILRKISEIGACRYQILSLKCTKITFCWGSAPDPAEGAYSAPRLLPLFKGPTSSARNGYPGYPGRYPLPGRDPGTRELFITRLLSTQHCRLECEFGVINNIIPEVYFKFTCKLQV